MFLDFIKKKEVIIISSFWSGFFCHYKLFRFCNNSSLYELSNSFLNGCFFSIGTFLILSIIPEELKLILHLSFISHSFYERWIQNKNDCEISNFKDIMRCYKIRTSNQLIKILDTHVNKN